MDNEVTRLRALLTGIALPWMAQPTIVDGDEIECSALVLCPYGDDGDRDMVAEIDMGHGVECDDAHAALIVAAVNALPALLDRVEAAERDALAPLVTEARRVLHWAKAVVDAWDIASSDGPSVDAVDAAIRTLADEAGDWTLAGPHTTHDALAKARDDAREERDAMRRERDEARAAAMEECAARCDEVAEGADDALHGMIPKGPARSAYLAGRRRGAELCAETIRTRAKGGE